MMTTIHEAAIKADIGTQEIDVSTYGATYDFTDDNTPPARHRYLNKSGIQPVEYKCLVKLDVVNNTTESGIIKSVGGDTEREQMAQVKGVLIAIGHNAFCDWNWKPPLGCRVMISKHEGIVCHGADQDENEMGAYRLISDKQLAAVITEE